VRIKQQLQYSGLSLIQLLLTITIAGILMGYAVPNMSEMIARSAVKSTATRFKNAVDYARRYAVKISSRTALCAGSPEDQCTSEDWDKGWTLFSVELDNNTTQLKPFKIYEPPRSSTQVIAENNNFAKSIVFNGRGRVMDSAELPVNFIFCSSRSKGFGITKISIFNQNYEFNPPNESLPNECT